MIAAALASTLALALVTQQPPQSQTVISFKWMGDMTCGGWRQEGGNYETVGKAALLNWVLGFINGRSALREANLLETVSPSGVASWLDGYCSNHPLGSLVDASYALERELMDAHRRRGSGSAPQR